jgi:hypothetical protein
MAIISTRPSIKLVKTRWRKKGPRTLADRAGVIGTNIWKISQEIFRHMESDGFRFGSDKMVIAVIAECVAFLVQIIDRKVYGKLADDDRAGLINGVAAHLAATMENNQLDLFGPGDYRGPFIALLNERFGEYATFEYDGGNPGYPCLRFFAGKIADAMAGADNRWVLEQVIDVEAPEMVQLMDKLIAETATDNAAR